MAKIHDHVPEDDTDPLEEAIASARKGAPPRVASAPLRQPIHSQRLLSDAELEAKYGAEDDGKFEIPPGFEPDGMKYEWKSQSVLGKENILGMSRYLRRGWQFVPADRHPGYWTEPGATGPIQYDGMVLMEIEAEEYENLRRWNKKQARDPVRGIYERLSAAPPGTGPRDAHPKTMPQIKRTYEPLPVE
jgi:hypothetical protein